MSTLYASFVDASAAEKAAGALLDQGAASADLSIVANVTPTSVHAVNANEKASDAEHSAKTGLSTTTAMDAATGAAKGATVGIGVGIAAVLASLFIPGLGLVIGGGALATALAGGAATIAAGGAAGGVVGYLKDQGVPEEMVTHYSNQFQQGGAILAVAIPTGSMRSVEIEAYLLKYGASNIATYNSSQARVDQVVQAPQVPLVVDNPNIDPIAVSPSVAVVDVAPVRTTTVIDAATGESRVVHTQLDTVVTYPETGMPITVAQVEPVTLFERPMIIDEDPEDSPIARRSDVKLY